MRRRWALLPLVAALLPQAAALDDVENASLPASASLPANVSCQLVRGADGSEDVVFCDGRKFTHSHVHERRQEAEEAAVGSSEWWTYLLSAVLCVSFAALAAGLTMGLMSLDAFDMELLLKMSLDDVHNEKDRAELLVEQAYARKISPVISSRFFAQTCAGLRVRESVDPTNHHYLLVTLLLVNAAANEALPLFLDNLVPAWAAVLVSIGFVLVFGEIIPSAVFTGPNQLAIAARLCPLVTLLKVLLAPLVWPISLVLDKSLGHQDEEMFSRAKLKALISLTYNTAKSGGHDQAGQNVPHAGSKAPLTEDEVHIIHGALELDHKKARDVCERWDTLKAVPSDALLTEQTMIFMHAQNHSRLLVYKGTPQAKSIQVTGANDPDLNEFYGYYERESLDSSTYRHTENASCIRFREGEWQLCSSEDAGECTCSFQSEDSVAGYVSPGDWWHKKMPKKKVKVDADTRQVLGLVVVKRLIAVNPEERRELEKTLGQWRQPLVFRPDMSLLKVLNMFQEGKSHMGILSNFPELVEEAWRSKGDIPKEALPTGFLTLEDVIEELLKEEVFDELDRKAAFGKMGKVWGWVQQRATTARTEVARRKQRGEPQQTSRRLISPRPDMRVSGDLGQPLLPSGNSSLLPSHNSGRRSLHVDRKV